MTVDRVQQGQANVLVTLRRQQGWRATIEPGTRQQLAEVHAEEPSVVSITCPDASVSAYDDAGTWIAETRVGEALRQRTFRSRACGVAFNVPAGVTRIFASADFNKQLPVLVSMAPGIAARETLTEYLVLPAAGTATVGPPPFARSLTVRAQNVNARVTVPFGQTNIYASTSGPGLLNATTIPALANTSIDNATFGAGVVSLEWELFA